jgi:hypothetical protein
MRQSEAIRGDDGQHDDQRNYDTKHPFGADTHTPDLYVKFWRLRHDAALHLNSLES